ncbi:hypothetical protein GCM10009527_075910 [Actinomadura nitritigenes]
MADPGTVQAQHHCLPGTISLTCTDVLFGTHSVSALGRDDGLQPLKPSWVAGLTGGFRRGLQQAEQPVS